MVKLIISDKLGTEAIGLGGPGSGNWAHIGRPGKVGGSSTRESGMSIAKGKDWQQRQLRKKYGTDSGAVSMALNDEKLSVEEKHKIVEAFMVNRGMADAKPARSRVDIPYSANNANYMTPQQIGSNGKLALFEEMNGTIDFSPIMQFHNKFYSGSFGNVREVKPLFGSQKSISTKAGEVRVGKVVSGSFFGIERKGTVIDIDGAGNIIIKTDKGAEFLIYPDQVQKV